FELLVPATAEQRARVGGEGDRYDRELRPGLMVAAIADLQHAGVEPDVWKIEGLVEPGDCARVAAQARSGGRERVGCVVLGRGADAAEVERWLRAGASTPGYLGFAIGRSIWWDSIKAWLAGGDREAAAREIAVRYRRFVDTYAGAAGDQPPATGRWAGPPGRAAARSGLLAVHARRRAGHRRRRSRPRRHEPARPRPRRAGGRWRPGSGRPRHARAVPVGAAARAPSRSSSNVTIAGPGRKPSAALSASMPVLTALLWVASAR